ncbi:Site-specific recombinase XerD [Devosia lucknowensis]|uniref:Site-specific recombinase XerD n=1 Tax=Devosia lucknowensis TaxID=1096929 RepID=A0A1Y6EH17_9HYPH|nr:site-specific integrase [Devosia lucknowensis]SMQ61918.1 Site-specific recombinase XerD [Devosia lucknowensis]
MEKVRKLKAGEGGRKTDKWIAAYYDANGKRRHKQFNTRDEAEDFQGEVRGEVKKGKHVPDSQSLTVEAANTAWLKAHKSSWEPATYQDYERTMKLHVLPFLQDKKLTQLENKDVLALVASLQEGKRSTFTIRRALVTLRSMLSFSMDSGTVSRNVVSESSRATGKILSGKARMDGDEEDGNSALIAGVDFPSTGEIGTLAKWLRAPIAPVGVKYVSMTVAGVVRWRPMILTIIGTGLRISEALGLRWKDCELTGDHLQIHVRQKIDRFGKAGAVKSKAGKRTIPINSELARTLLDHKKACPASELDLVFPTASGQPQSKSNFLARGLKPAWKLAGITNGDGEAKYTGAHCLRHFYASWLINPVENGGRGMEPFMAIKRLGHSDVAILTKVYGHAFGQTKASRNEEEEAAARLFG